MWFHHCKYEWGSEAWMKLINSRSLFVLFLVQVSNTSPMLPESTATSHHAQHSPSIVRSHRTLTNYCSTMKALEVSTQNLLDDRCWWLYLLLIASWDIHVCTMSFYSTSCLPLLQQLLCVCKPPGTPFVHVYRFLSLTESYLNLLSAFGLTSSCQNRVLIITLKCAPRVGSCFSSKYAFFEV